MKETGYESKILVVILSAMLCSWSVWALYRIYFKDTSPKVESEMLCYDLHTEFLDQEGWKRATPADRPHLVQLAERGLLEWREEKSLQCHAALDPAKEWLAGELWFRTKVKRTKTSTGEAGA